MSPAARRWLIWIPFLKERDGCALVQIHPGSSHGCDGSKFVDSTRWFFHTFLFFTGNSACEALPQSGILRLHRKYFQHLCLNKNKNKDTWIIKSCIFFLQNNLADMKKILSYSQPCDLGLNSLVLLYFSFPISKIRIITAPTTKECFEDDLKYMKH